MINTVEPLNVGLDKIECVVHIADIHVRLTQRHDEYREAFEKMYAHIKATPVNTLIAVLGDVNHCKVEMAPESIQLVSEFLKNLADLRPTVLVAGNHDCLLTNKSRLDSLSPIVDNLGHKNLFYLKESKLYGVANVLINNMSIFDDPLQYIKIADASPSLLNKFDHKVAFYHGGIHGVTTDIGYIIQNKAVTTDMFSGHDIVMLGDIHKEQTFYIEKILPLTAVEEFVKLPDAADWDMIDDPSLADAIRIRQKSSPIFRYSGSALQQNHGEHLLGHGMTVWNMSDRTYSHIEIPNDYGHFTIEIDNGSLATNVAMMPVKAKLRVNCKESVSTDVKKVVTEIRKSHQISDLVYVRVESEAGQQTAMAKTASNLTQISSVEYQNQLISDFLRRKYADIDDVTVDAACAINVTQNAAIQKDDRSRNIKWRAKRMEFSNMFSYGEDNVVDFTKLDGVYGLFAPNASGKSSLFEVLSFIIFDKSYKTFKASLVINSQKMSFRGMFQFEVNGVDYYIVREGTRDKKNSVKVTVNFYKKVDDVDVPLNAEARRSTNEIIRDYVGTYEDFILTALSLQSNTGSFVDMGQTDRKELLCQFIGITLFDTLNASAADRIKEIGGAIKAFNKEDNTKKSAEMEVELEMLTAKLAELVLQGDALNLEARKLRDAINVESREIVNLMDVPTDPAPLRVELTSCEVSRERLAKEIDAIEVEIESLEEKLEGTNTRWLSVSSADVQVKANEYRLASKELKIVEDQMDRLKTSVGEKLKKLAHLDQHKYDPNCKYCVDNVFVKDAIATRESLAADKAHGTELKDTIRAIKETLETLLPSYELYQQATALQLERSDISKSISDKRTTVTVKKSNLERSSARIIKIGELLSLYERSEAIVKKNNRIGQVVADLTKALRTTEANAKTKAQEITTTTSRRVSVADQIATVTKQISTIEVYEEEYAAYEYYLSAIGGSGIPYQIISEAIPRIESEANTILAQVAPFSVELEPDGKNVNAYIKYDERRWPLELCSGMERFISGIALRAALTNISNLPRPNFLIVDEGMSALDGGNMAMIRALFDCLKNNFDFIIVVSHQDTMRDMVDKQLEIKKENGYSKVDNTK